MRIEKCGYPGCSICDNDYNEPQDREASVTYTPSAWTKRHDSRWWIFLVTPSGAVVRLLMSYANQKEAETGLQFFGFKLIAEHTVGTLHRRNSVQQ